MEFLLDTTIPFVIAFVVLILWFMLGNLRKMRENWHVSIMGIFETGKEGVIFLQ